jgi:hypothetical protein
MITKETLAQANKGLEAITVKGKSYVMVNKRVEAFRAICPDGAITTDIITNAGGVVVMKATVMDETGKVLSTGLSYEKEGNNTINKTSYIENCETSAVGRALGFLGIGIDGSMASAEEVANAILQQSEGELIGKMKVDIIRADIENGLINEADLLKYYRISRLEDMTEKQFSQYAEQKQKREAQK